MFPGYIYSGKKHIKNEKPISKKTDFASEYRNDKVDLLVNNLKTSDLLKDEELNGVKKNYLGHMNPLILSMVLDVKNEENRKKNKDFSEKLDSYLMDEDSKGYIKRIHLNINDEEQIFMLKQEMKLYERMIRNEETDEI